MTDGQKNNYVSDLEKAPDMDTLERFFQFLARNYPGRSDTRMSVETLKRDWFFLRKLVRLRTGYKYEEDENRSLFQVILK